MLDKYQYKQQMEFSFVGKIVSAVWLGFLNRNFTIVTFWLFFKAEKNSFIYILQTIDTE